MKSTSYRTLDNKAERSVSSFLANHYYSVLKANGSIAGFETITDPALQRRGVDFIVTNTDGTKTNVDLKAAVAYINEHLPSCGNCEQQLPYHKCRYWSHISYQWYDRF